MIRIHRVLFFLLLTSASQAQAFNATTLRGNLRGLAAEDEYSTGQVKTSQRYLMKGHHNFVPLEGCSTCDSWTTWTAESYNPSADTVVIPCGLCVTMDYPGDTLVLPHGLDIQGSLDFPDGYQLKMEAPFVRVQGVLSMTATQAVTDTPNVQFLLTGGDESVTDFVPAGANQYACSESDTGEPEPCHVGAKPIVVAGGRLDIRGLRDECKTWVTLHDVASRTELPQPTEYTELPEPDPSHPTEICRSLDPYLQEDFETSLNLYGWSGGYGAHIEITSTGSFRVFDRKSDAEHGPTWDLLEVRDCLVPNQKYLFSARVRLVKPSMPTGTPTTCAELGTNCLELQSSIRFDTSQANRQKGQENQESDFEYGKWQDFYATFDFSEEELGLGAIYHIFQLRGPESDVEIEIDDVVFSLPPVGTVPDPNNVCGGNLIMNGEAEASSIHPYPMESFGGHLTVQTGGAGNNYFRLINRKSDNDSIAYYMDAPGCIVAGARYRAWARIRVRSSHDVPTELSFRAFFTDGKSTKYTVASCPPSQRGLGFVQCESEFAVANDFDAEHVESIRFTFETVGGPTDDVDVAAWRLEFVEGPTANIIVQENGVEGCWDEGAEILITSHTIDFESSQVRRIASTPQSTGGGVVTLELDDFIVSPVTEQDGDGFAVEVALLSRNILFLGAIDEDDSLLGGHLIVLHTPAVQQIISGVEIKNFGRQGELGRYPIHFHISSDVDGALVSKNAIRDSNQRCVVVHGTYNVTVTENVAYETKGHCYMTEDGGEIDNVFIRNLGASTRAAARKVRPMETDDIMPSTFWCPNPMNTWIGNVAAGSESSGFWFELEEDVRPPTSFLPLSNGMSPRRMSLKLFRDNIAHSNWRHGLRTYPNGFHPPTRATFDNTKSYKNRLDGIFFHQSADLLIQGGILADNSIQADFDMADNIAIDGTTIIGVTTRYKEILNTQLGTLSHDEQIVGLELHNFAIDTTRQGATIRNIVFSGFSDTRTETALIRIDGRAPLTGNFDYWTTIQGVHIMEDVTPFQFDFRDAISNDVAGVYLVDLDSSMKPAGSTVTGTSTIVSNSPEATAFLDLSRCESFDEAAYLYCSTTCMRTITFAVNPSGTGNYLLRMADDLDPTKSFSFSGKFDRATNDDGTPDETSNTDLRKLRYFAAALPQGHYVAQFVSGDNDLAWPTFVETTIEPSLCTNALEADSVRLEIPSPSNAECRELVRNGGMEWSDSSYPRWLHFDSGLELVSGAGIDGSNAIADMYQSVSSGEIGQYVDVRCLTEGSMYEVQAWVRLELNHDPFACDGSNCPFLRLRMRTKTDERGEEFSYSFVNLADRFARPYDGNGWNLLHGWFTVDDSVANATSVALIVERGRANVKMFLDDVSMSRIQEDCSDLVFNGDLSSESSIFWEKDTDEAVLEMVYIEEGNPALKMADRSSDQHSIIQNIRTGCMVEGHRYVAVAKVRMLNSDGSFFECDPTSRTGQAVCPRMRLRSFVNVSLPTQDAMGHDGNSIAETDHGVPLDGWYTMSGAFIATEYDERADKSVLSFEDAPRNKDLVIDDVSIVALPMNCSQLILNGNAEGESASFWRHWINNDGTKIEVVPAESGGHALKVSNRAKVGDGITQTVDPRCTTSGSTWKLAAKMKLFSRSSGQPVVCNPLETNRIESACPPVRVAGFQSGSKLEDEKNFMENNSTWIADAWNDFEVEFTISSTVATCDRVAIAIRSYNLDWDVLLEDISVTPL